MLCSRQGRHYRYADWGEMGITHRLTTPLLSGGSELWLYATFLASSGAWREVLVVAIERQLNIEGVQKAPLTWPLTPAAAFDVAEGLVFGSFCTEIGPLISRSRFRYSFAASLPPFSSR